MNEGTEDNIFRNDLVKCVYMLVLMIVVWYSFLYNCYNEGGLQSFQDVFFDIMLVLVMVVTVVVIYCVLYGNSTGKRNLSFVCGGKKYRYYLGTAKKNKKEIFPQYKELSDYLQYKGFRAHIYTFRK